MPELIVGQNYTRNQVAEIIGMPDSRRVGGNWATGYDEWDGSFYVFAGVGTTGRTGHDYGNRWDGHLLAWSGKGTTKLGQRTIDRIASNTLPVHIFWRGDNRSPFTYAGIGTAREVADTVPVRVLWEFDGGAAGSPVDPTMPRPQTFRRGPPPVVGEIRTERIEGPADVYLLRLEGPVSAIMELPPGHVVIKVGMSGDVDARVSQLNYGFPAGSRVRWAEFQRRRYPDSNAAYRAEGACLELFRLNGWWLNGEFAMLPADELDGLLERASPR